MGCTITQHNLIQPLDSTLGFKFGHGDDFSKRIISIHIEVRANHSVSMGSEYTDFGGELEDSNPAMFMNSCPIESFEGVKEGFCDPRNLLTFSNISDLDSEDEFVNNLINFPSEGESEQFAVACLPSPPASASEDEKKSRIDSRSRKFTAPMNVSARASAQRSRVKRRGRKPSFTEDPSKTFVCNLCNHRFRRQEHLKRHHLSLHTQEKPFECHKCRKTFSRNDNLSQHALTHD